MRSEFDPIPDLREPAIHAAWMDRAACNGEDPEVFFPSPSDWGAIDKAKAICARCSVQSECQELAEGDVWGVWAGVMLEEPRPPKSVDQHDKRTHCAKGHEYTEENTRIRDTHGRTWRACRTCDRGHRRKAA